MGGWLPSKYIKEGYIMKILAITDYPFWTVGDIYNVIYVEEVTNGKFR
jgi:hypothetical protein